MRLRSDNILMAVMSYDMGELLRNCLMSIERNSNGVDVAIFDDGSTNPITREVLREYGTKYRVTVSVKEDPREWKTGGLHANMNRAIDFAVANGFDYVLFVQDDMQLVRPIDEATIDEYARIFAADEGIAQIRCTFMKSPVITPDHSPFHWRPDPGGLHYERMPAPNGVLDVGLVDVTRLAERGFRFLPGEGNNSQRSREMGLRTVFPKNPLLMWLPWPPTVMTRLSRGKQMLNMITDRLFGVGCHPFRDMTSAEVAAMSRRPAEELPYAERFLKLTVKSVPKPWCYEHSYTYPAAIIRELRQGRWPWREVR